MARHLPQTGETAVRAQAHIAALLQQLHALAAITGAGVPDGPATAQPVFQAQRGHHFLRGSRLLRKGPLLQQPGQRLALHGGRRLPGREGHAPAPHGLRRGTVRRDTGQQGLFQGPGLRTRGIDAQRLPGTRPGTGQQGPAGLVTIGLLPQGHQPARHGMEAGQPQLFFRQGKAAQLAGRGRILGKKHLFIRRPGIEIRRLDGIAQTLHGTQAAVDHPGQPRPVELPGQIHGRMQDGMGRQTIQKQ